MGEMITDVGIDLDGVIYPFAQAFQRYCAERKGMLFLPEPTHWHFYEDWDLDADTFNKWLVEAAQTHTVFATEEPYEGVKEAWQQMLSMGLKIHVLTARPQASWEQTAGWLTEHGLHVDTLHFCPSKSLLAKIAKGKAIMIDDHVAYYEEAETAGVIPVLMNRAWNSDKEGATRVNNLLEFVSLIRGYNLVRKQDAKKDKTITKLSEKKFPYRNPWTEPYKNPYHYEPQEPKKKWGY